MEECLRGGPARVQIRTVMAKRTLLLWRGLYHRPCRRQTVAPLQQAASASAVSWWSLPACGVRCGEGCWGCGQRSRPRDALAGMRPCCWPAPSQPGWGSEAVLPVVPGWQTSGRVGCQRGLGAGAGYHQHQAVGCRGVRSPRCGAGRQCCREPWWRGLVAAGAAACPQRMRQSRARYAGRRPCGAGGWCGVGGLEAPGWPGRLVSIPRGRGLACWRGGCRQFRPGVASTTAKHAGMQCAGAPGLVSIPRCGTRGRPDMAAGARSGHC